VSEAGFKIALPIDQFKRLRGRRQVPCYLVMVVVPPEPRDYIRQSGDALILRHSAYWLSWKTTFRFRVTRRAPLSPCRATICSQSTVLHEFFNRACEEVPTP